MKYTTLIIFSLFLSLYSLGQVQGIVQKGLLAYYPFDGSGADETGKNPDFDLVNTEFNENTLYINGKYEYNTDKTGYRAVAYTPDLNYNTFSIVVKFKLATPRKGASQPILICAGTSYRWFGIRFSEDSGGKLIVCFNNGDFRQRLEGTIIAPEEWVVLTCTVDIPARKVVVYRDGIGVGTIDLPKDFVLDVIGATVPRGDKEWTFTDYSGADMFYGWIDDLAIYDRVLSADEVRQK